MMQLAGPIGTHLSASVITWQALRCHLRLRRHSDACLYLHCATSCSCASSCTWQLYWAWCRLLETC